MRLFILAAIVCFAIALLGAINAFSGVNVIGWIAGGLLAWSIDAALGGWALAVPGRAP